MKPEIKNRLSRLPGMLFTGITAAIILWLTLASRPFGSIHTPFFPGADKVVHGMMFGFLVMMMALDNVRTNFYRPISLSLLIIYALVSSLFGIAIEFLQEWFPTGRSFELTDMGADAIGAFLGAIAWYLFQPKLTKKND